MTLSRYGIREWGIATAVAVVALVLANFALWAIITTLILWVAVAGFFRDPLFRKPATNNARDLVSPADGVVSAVLSVDHHEAVGGPATIVRIFLSVLDVHINRAPCDCTVTSIRHTPGKYLDARTAESAKVNESNLISVVAFDGTKLGIRQVSGAIARRIVCPLSTGATLTRAQRFGMIKFGSTTELIVPTTPALKVHVKVSDRVTGGVTILAAI